MTMAFWTPRTGRGQNARSAQPLDLNEAAFGLRDRWPRASAGQSLRPPPVLLLGPLGFVIVLIILFNTHVLTLIAFIAMLGVLGLSALRLGAAVMAGGP